MSSTSGRLDYRINCARVCRRKAKGAQPRLCRSPVYFGYIMFRTRVLARYTDVPTWNGSLSQTTCTSPPSPDATIPCSGYSATDGAGRAALRLQLKTCRHPDTHKRLSTSLYYRQHKWPVASGRTGESGELKKGDKYLHDARNRRGEWKGIIPEDDLGTLHNRITITVRIFTLIDCVHGPPCKGSRDEGWARP